MPSSLIFEAFLIFHLVYHQGPNVWESIHLLQLFILNEYATQYAIPRHYFGLVKVDE